MAFNCQPRYNVKYVSKFNIIFLGRKHDLRYGFHKIAECESFEKSFLCIQKCVDLNYDVAYADKNCKCTCYIKKDREKYKSVSPATRTRWRSGAPKTSVPPWAGGVPPINEDSATENYNMDSREEGNEIKDASTNSSNVEEILKDDIPTGDGSNSTAAVTIADITNLNNSAIDTVSNTSMPSSDTPAIEETTIVAPVE